MFCALLQGKQAADPAAHFVDAQCAAWRIALSPRKKLRTRDGHVCGRKRNARAVSAGGALALLRVDVNNAIVRKLGFTCMLSGNAPAISHGRKPQVRLQPQAGGRQYARVHRARQPGHGVQAGVEHLKCARARRHEVKTRAFSRSPNLAEDAGASGVARFVTAVC
jgi:hypothetical protein